MEFHESGDRAPTDFFFAVLLFLLAYFVVFPPWNRPTDRLTVSASSSSSQIPPPIPLCFVFYRCLAPLLLSTALLTSKWGDPFCSFSVFLTQRSNKPPDITFGSAVSIPTRSHFQFLLERWALPSSTRERETKKSPKGIRDSFILSDFFFLRLSSSLSARVRAHCAAATTRR